MPAPPLAPPLASPPASPARRRAARPGPARRLLGALLGVAPCALAGEPEPAAPLPRVEVVGQALPRLDAETAAPITLLDADTLRREGVTRLEQALDRLPAQAGLQRRSGVVGTDSGGASFADLRGLGPDKTLVLLNGRRLAANAVLGTGVDLNLIPFDRVERIEVLRDGASALYGSEAVGGVVNIITRPGGPGSDRLSLGVEGTQHGGGASRDLALALGFGDWQARGFDGVVALGLRRSEALAARQRRFTRSGVQPSRGIDYASSIHGPANYSQAGGFDHPHAPACAGPDEVAGDGECRLDILRRTDLLPASREQHAHAQARLRLPGGQQLSVEHLIARHDVLHRLAGQPLVSEPVAIAPGTPFFPGAGRVPGPTAFVLDPGAPVDLWAGWRAPGARENRADNRAQRLVLELAGPLGAWTQRSGLSLQESRVEERRLGGHHDEARLAQALRDGLLNPFGDQDAEGQAQLEAARVGGTLNQARGRVLALDGQARRSLDLGLAAPAGLALGGEWRHEAYRSTVQDALARALPSSGFDPAADVRAGRRVAAAWAELLLPLAPSLEATLALRHDRHSDAGRATTPKLALRWQADPGWLLRASIGRGFRAPSLYELRQPALFTFDGAFLSDPLRCPDGESGADCSTQFRLRGGGNPELRPERATQAGLGLVLQPARGVSLAADLWAVRVRDAIVRQTAAGVLADPARFGSLVLRGADGAIEFIDTPLFNAAELRAEGVDLALRWTAPPSLLPGVRLQARLDATQVFSHTLRDGLGGPTEQRVGRHGSQGPLPRWQHSAGLSLAWARWTLDLAQRGRSGYTDENRVDPALARRVGSHRTWDLGLAWQPSPALQLLAVLRNLTDRAPPFSNQGSQFQSGYEPRLDDPLGRSLALRLVWTP